MQQTVEYKVVGVSIASDPSKNTIILNEQAGMGWRLFSIQYVDTHSLHYVFERPYVAGELEKEIAESKANGLKPHHR